MHACLDAARHALRLRLYDPQHPEAATFRSRQLASIVAMTPATLAANIVNGAMVLASCWGLVAAWPMVLWYLAILGSTALGFPGWLRMRSGRWPSGVSTRALNRVVVHAAVVAALWALLPAWLIPSAGEPGTHFGWVVAVGVMWAGGLLLRNVPAAGTSFTLVIAAGAAVGLWRTQAPAMLATTIGMYTLWTLLAIRVIARSHAQRLVTEAESSRQGHVIGLLLRDFAADTSDLLWEIDPQGRLTVSQERFCAVLGVEGTRLTAEPFLDLLARAEASDAERDTGVPESALGVAALRLRMAGRQAFRDHLVALRVGTQVTWWSITAKPRVDGRGEFGGWRGVAADITRSQLATTKLRHLAHHDVLTGLLNRHQFPFASREVLACGAGGALAPCTVLSLDLDDFKATNDTLGTAVGDAVLVEVARRLRAATRRGDVVARLGGDEFAVVMPGVASVDEADALAHRLAQSVQAPFAHQGIGVPVRASIGLALAPNDGDTLEALMQHASLARLEAKRAAGGDVRFFDPRMALATRRRLAIERGLREAVERGGLRLAFQPQVDLRRWRVTGFEALVRWRDPVLGEVSPAEFIPIAESCGLILPIGQWVMEEACRQAARWPGDIGVSVNVSAVQVMSPTLMQMVEQALAQAGLAARRLEIEITESVVMHEVQRTEGLLSRLHALGLRIALDDFGTGYSSLAYLRRFPFDTLKIDRAFIRELLTRRDARAIVRTILGLTSTLSMSTIAEGVEEEAQALALAADGCDVIQGFHIARPMPAEDVAGFLREWPQRAQRLRNGEALLDAASAI